MFKTEIYFTTDFLENARPEYGDFSELASPSRLVAIRNEGENSVLLKISAFADNDLTFEVVLYNEKVLTAHQTLLLQETRSFSAIRVQAKSEIIGMPTNITTGGFIGQ